jgi:hypothetical protein
MQVARTLPYGGYFAVYRHEEPRMRQQILSKQRDLFSSPATAPPSLPVAMRPELVILLNALLLEVILHQRSQAHRAQQEPCHEQQDHA